MAANKRGVGYRLNRRRSYSTSAFPVPNRGIGKLHRDGIGSKYRSRSSLNIGSSSRPRRRLLEGVNQDKLRRIIKIVAFLVVVGIGVGAIVLSVNSGGRELPTPQEQETVSKTDQVITVADTGANITISLGGNIKLQNEVINAAKSGSSYDFNNYLSELSSVLSADLSIVSVLGTLDNVASNSDIAGFPKANYPASLADALSNVGINAVATANPYALKSGYEGLSSTIDIYRQEGIEAIGTGKSASNSYVVKDIDSIKVGIGSYSCVTSDELAALKAEQRSSGMTDEQIAQCITQLDIKTATSTILKDVAAMREQGAKFIIIIVNWGSANTTAPNYEMRSLAQDMIDNGVDVTLGTGIDDMLKVTVKQHKESDGSTKNCYVFYSLGSLFSDPSAGSDIKDYQSMVINFNLVREPESEVVKLEAAYYHPIYNNRDETHASEATYLKYRVVPAARYVDASVRPSVFSTDKQWNNCKNTFSTIRTKIQTNWVVGNYLVLGEVDKSGAKSDEGGAAASL